MSKKEVLAYAKTNIGYTEGKNNSNIFAHVAGHPNHQPWCATFIVACFKVGQEGKAIKDSASVIEIAKWAIRNAAVIEASDAEPGDVLLFDFSGHGYPEHVELATSNYNRKTKTIRTIGGNTGSGRSGNQSNGDGVYQKARGYSTIHMAIRPKWGKNENQS